MWYLAREEEEEGEEEEAEDVALVPLCDSLLTAARGNLGIFPPAPGVPWLDSGYSSCVSLRLLVGHFKHFLRVRGPRIPRSILILDIFQRAHGFRQSRARCLPSPRVQENWMLWEMTSGRICVFSVAR